MLVVHILEVIIILQVDHKQGDERHTRYERTGKRIPAVHRTVPMRIDAHQPKPRRRRKNGQGKYHDEQSTPYRIVPDVFFAAFQTGDRIFIQTPGELTHFPPKERPKSDGEESSDRKEVLIQESFLVIQDRIFRHVMGIGPMVNGMIVSKCNGEQDGHADHADHRHNRGDGFGHPTESHLPTAPSEGSGTDEEHGSIHHQQKEYTVLQERSPESSSLMSTFRAMGEPESGNGQQANRHQREGDGVVTLRCNELIAG